MYMAKAKTYLKIDDFLNFKTPEAVYLMGFLWADGHLTKKGYRISICMHSKDLKDLNRSLKKTGKWQIRYRKCGIIVNIEKSCKEVHQFLKLNGYKTDADKFLKLIPSDLRKYWLRGLIDGDGNIFINNKQTKYRVSVTSAIDENWDYLKNVCDDLYVNYRIQKRKTFNETTQNYNHSSHFLIESKYHSKTFLDYIYSGADEDNICFQRKYKKYLATKKIPIYHNTNNYRGINKYEYKDKIEYLVYAKAYVGQKKILIGRFKCPEEAAICYDEYSVKNFGIHCILNFPIQNYLNLLEEFKLSKTREKLMAGAA